MNHKKNIKNTKLKRDSCDVYNENPVDDTSTYFLFAFTMGCILGACTVVSLMLVNFVHSNNAVKMTNILPMKTDSCSPDHLKDDISIKKNVYQPKTDPIYQRHTAAVQNYSSPGIISLPNLFTPQECELIIKELEKTKLIDGKIKHGPKDTMSKEGGVNKKTRRSKMGGLQKEQWKWVYDRMMSRLTNVNKKYWNFRLPKHRESKLVEVVQFALYNSSDRGEYNWHQDTGIYGRTAMRTISGVVQLSSPEDYEGGKLQINDFHQNVYDAPSEQGNGVLFQSYLIHRVMPVSKGVRRSLAFWFQSLDFP